MTAVQQKASDAAVSPSIGVTLPLVCHLCAHEVQHDPRAMRAARAAAGLANVVGIGMSRMAGSPTTVEFDHVRINNLKVTTKNSRWVPRNVFGWSIKYLEMLTRYVLAARRLRPDIVHSHDLVNLPIALLVRLFTGAKVVYDAHELYPDTGNEQQRRTLVHKLVCLAERMFIKRADAIIAANQARAEVMQKRYNLRETPTPVENISESIIRVESTRTRDFIAECGGKADTVVFYQGGMAKMRGIHNLIEAMSHVRPGVALVLLGPEDNMDITAEIARAGVGDRVFYHKAVPLAEVHEWSCSADLGVVIYRNTGLNNYLCAPNKIYDYLMSGIAVIGSDLPNVRKVVAEYDVGELFDPESPESIARAITAMTSNPNRLEQARRNIPAVWEKYNWPNERERLLGVYRRLLEGRKLRG